MIIEFINRLIWYSMFLADEENHLVLINVLQQNSNITNMDISNLRLIYVSETLLFKPIYNYRI